VKPFLSVLVAICAQSADAGDRIAVGTVVVIAQTQHRVIIAADSRVATMDQGLRVNAEDSQCKIAALGGHLVFASAGLLGDGSNTWSATSEAVAAWSGVEHDGSIKESDGVAALERWAQLIMGHIVQFTAGSLMAYAQANEWRLADGLMAGIGIDGKTWVRAVEIRYDRQFRLSGQDIVLKANDPPTGYSTLGLGEIVAEFEDDKTSARAIAERRRWKTMGLSGVRFDRFKAYRLAELTIKYARKKEDVGGTIDEIELDAKGCRWLHRKPNCNTKN
jgi:hypothetical protein